MAAKKGSRKNTHGTSGKWAIGIGILILAVLILFKTNPGILQGSLINTANYTDPEISDIAKKMQDIQVEMMTMEADMNGMDCEQLKDTLEKVKKAKQEWSQLTARLGTIRRNGNPSDTNVVEANDLLQEAGSNKPEFDKLIKKLQELIDKKCQDGKSKKRPSSALKSGGSADAAGQNEQPNTESIQKPQSLKNAKK